MVEDGEFDWKRFAASIRTGVRFLDNVLTVNSFPIEECREVHERSSFNSPSLEKFQRIALAHSVYHACKHDPCCIVNSYPVSCSIVKERAQGHCDAYLRIITGSRRQVASQNTVSSFDSPLAVPALDNP